MPAPDIRNILIVCPTLKGGGAERVVSSLANHWAAEGRRVTVVTLSHANTDFYRLAPSVQRHALNMDHASRNFLHGLLQNIGRVRGLRKVVRTSSAELVISFVSIINVQLLLATRGLLTPVVVSERVDPAQKKIAPHWEWLRRRAYAWADAVVAQTDQAAEWFRKNYGLSNLRVIGNPILRCEAPNPGLRERLIVAAGRLERQKGFDVLIDAFSQSEARREWRLAILGEGPERAKLEMQVRALGLEGRVAVTGHVDPLSDWLTRAGLFVLSSRFEGFPNVLAEAMAAGLPVVSTDCPSGPRALITPNENGLLVPVEDPKKLAAAIDMLTQNPALAHRLASEAPNVVDRYDLRKIADAWLALGRVAA